MIDFLKESTFAVKDVIQLARVVLKRYYFAIVGLCLLLFLVPTISRVLAALLNDIHPILNILFLLIFVLTYFGFQLTIIKYIFHALDKEENEVSVIKAWPSTTEVINFLLGTLSFIICCLIILAVFALLGLPLVYMGVSKEDAVTIAISIATLVIFIASIRVVFFPYFIIDRQIQPLRALRLSLAITRGNFVKILLLLSFFAIFHILYLYLEYNEFLGLSLVVLFINSFFIIPLSSVALAIAYRIMMSEYKGDQDPDVMDNII
ncbi:beta-carotene 15,15'-monooxygenase [Paradesertivirga mongoliensis]|uniref:Beta-carotene 15,15'-monooxygenase n=1 Tax=Paradesertivirga mongoliensis TaxID=2100740 RepID=A0ABW4ZR05_9SPHI|nr:beta-carotene 15,15'-monooxygenase [Pedobacter mongoliensis]